jgi:UDP-3-O-[3-hydroxymyristoyl] N-acetylglucosamine deacetylase
MGPTTSSETASAKGGLLFSYSGRGLSSRAPVEVAVYQSAKGSGITFSIPNPKADRGASDERVLIPACADFVVSTLRNTVLGQGSARLCIVEHFLAACALWGCEDLFVLVDGLEMPLVDGSARFWMELFENSSIPRIIPEPSVAIHETVSVQDGDRQLIAIPAEKLTLSYLLDLPHPMIGKRWRSWTADEPYADIAYARTFGSSKENEMLGVQDDVVSLTASGFTKPLIYDDEPVRHKLLDLLGDLVLIGLNPVKLKAHVISIKGGHKLDVELAKRLRDTLKSNTSSRSTS